MLRLHKLHAAHPLRFIGTCFVYLLILDYMCGQLLKISFILNHAWDYLVFSNLVIAVIHIWKLLSHEIVNYFCIFFSFFPGYTCILNVFLTYSMLLSCLYMFIYFILCCILDDLFYITNHLFPFNGLNLLSVHHASYIYIYSAFQLKNSP